MLCWAVSSQTVAGWIEPSRCRCNSALGREEMLAGRSDEFIRGASMRQLWPAGINPCGHPIRADIGGRFGKLPDQDGGGLVVEAIVIFVVVGVRLSRDVGVAIRQENRLQPTVRGEAHLERMIGRIVDVRG